MVGSVIVHNNNIIGEGWHTKAGKPHAEVNAIASVKDKQLLKEATIYVSLEPCSHFGKTPPCSDLIIKEGIPNVVIGTVDPFSEVAGRGIKKLIEAGCNVTVGVLEDECNDLNSRFFTYHTQKRPYIILKWAQTKEGFLAPESKDEVAPVWISNTYAKQLVHKWRSIEDAILVGTNTVLADNPSLTTREWAGKNPTRIVLDKSLRIPTHTEIYNKDVKTIIITEKETGNKNNIYFENIDFTNNVAKQICSILYKHGIQSIIIEGGAQTLQTFINENLWDEARVFTGNTIFEKGIKAPHINKPFTQQKQILDNQLHIYKNK
ncbi:riboflavin biosynthesis protein RibD [Neptunitalea sp. Y10]|uniref:Riboflavin biosynthesis protein RibD n=2 Tax=Neptunitalea lumnitzerae TaxID=2965509 RepID=A0ABQ5MK23_9FLAO|nr:riboflavin biosynthesis protein RibD [Neptunitalea sp. Y10]